MAKSRSFVNHLNLVHDISIKSRETPKNLVALLDKLKNTDVTSESVQLLKSELPELINQNISKSNVLTEFLNATPDKIVKNNLVVRRESPLNVLNAAGRLSGLSMVKASETFGPIRANDGRFYWYDFLSYEKLIPVFLIGDPSPIMLIPLKLSKLARPVTNYVLAKGSIWIRADLFAVTAGSSKYTGFIIKSGKLILSEATGITSDSLRLKAAATFNLELALDNTFELKGEGNCGSDSRNADIKLPDLVKFQCAAKKIKINEISTSSWNLYGDKRQFSYDQKAAVYNADLDKIFIPFKSDLPEFSIKVKSSDFFNIEGQAPVKDSVWCLSLAALDITKPFAIRNNGALGVLCKLGLSCSWSGLPAGTDIL
jgi:hypothetical protein